MKKNGFTLAEVLITLGIIGVIAALVGPTISKVKPDENKIMYLKTYDALSSIISGLASNSSIFPVCDSDDNVMCSQYPLFNLSMPLKAPYNTNSFVGTNKLCRLLADNLSVQNENCSSSNYNSNSAFSTQDGKIWWVSTSRSFDHSTHKANYQTEINVDVNGQKAPNCMNSVDNNCSNPDRFRFLVSADGSITPADPIGQMYVQSRQNLKISSKTTNANLIANATNREFDYQYCSPNDVTITLSITGGNGYRDFHLSTNKAIIIQQQFQQVVHQYKSDRVHLQLFLNYTLLT